MRFCHLTKILLIPEKLEMLLIFVWLTKNVLLTHLVMFLSIFFPFNKCNFVLRKSGTNPALLHPEQKLKPNFSNFLKSFMQVILGDGILFSIRISSVSKSHLTFAYVCYLLLQKLEFSKIFLSNH